MVNFIEYAEELAMEGFNPLPLKKDKAPMLNVGHPFLYEPIDKIPSRFGSAEAFGIACGKVSGGFYAIDFDCHQGLGHRNHIHLILRKSFYPISDIN